MPAFRQPIHVFVIAPVILCWGLERLVNTAGPSIRIRGSAPSLDLAMKMASRAPADVLVVDYDEEQRPDKLQAAARVFPIVLLTTGDASGVTDRLSGYGAASAVRKADATSLLLHAIKAAWEGQPQGARASHWPASVDHARLDGGDLEQTRIDSLTLRERQLILVVVCNACDPGKVLADRLGISEHTLRNHLTSIYTKLGVHSRLSLHSFAARRHLDRKPGPRGADDADGPRIAQSP
jgi:two-component system nitrate/nitrite response regulator NarL